MAGARLVSLVGPGGVGKTRLAVRVASDLQRGFTNGAWWVHLAETARRLSSHYPTLVAPCPEYITQGGRPEGRLVYIELDDSPEVTMLDEANNELPSLSLQLTKGESAEVTFVASVLALDVGYEWSANLAYIFEGQARQVRLSAEGWYRVASAADNHHCWSDLRTPNAVRANDSLSDWCG